MFFRRVYTVYGIRSIFQRHSPGGGTVLLCLICYLVRWASGWGGGWVCRGGCLGWRVRGREKGISLFVVLWFLSRCICSIVLFGLMTIRFNKYYYYYYIWGGGTPSDINWRIGDGDPLRPIALKPLPFTPWLRMAGRFFRLYVILKIGCCRRISRLSDNNSQLTVHATIVMKYPTRIQMPIWETILFAAICVSSAAYAFYAVFEASHGLQSLDIH